jgi:hypothetical protein
MTYLAFAVAFGWLCIMLVLVGWQMNLLRKTLNNLKPGADYWAPEYWPLRKGRWLSEIKPELLNTEGWKYLKRSHQIAWLDAAWKLVGVALAIWISLLLNTSS